ncbi:MAG: NAD-dependent epimerase/dehydratase family protein [Legionella sp.]|nr:NAD-dependent epimerase/dehydratase family protein [Legionella sp.]
MRILVTGGCGFIGSHLVQFYLEQGHEVFAVDNLSTGFEKNIKPFLDNPLFTFEKADIITWSSLTKVVQWADVIFNFAATVGMFNVIVDPIAVVSNNIVGTNRLLRTIALSDARPTVIIASSSSVYGDNPKGLLSEEDSLIVKPLTHPLATYAISKLADEAIGYAYYHHHKIPLFLARMFNTIGPHQTGLYGMVVPRFVKQACSNEPITIYGDGKQTRSFCDVRDIIVALDLLLKQPKALGQSINIGNDYEISINDLAKLVKKCANSSSQITHISYKEAYGVDYTDIGQRRPNLTKLYGLVPFKHKWTLDDTINYLIEEERRGSN